MNYFNSLSEGKLFLESKIYPACKSVKQVLSISVFHWLVEKEKDNHPLCNISLKSRWSSVLIFYFLTPFSGASNSVLLICRKHFNATYLWSKTRSKYASTDFLVGIAIQYIYIILMYSYNIYTYVLLKFLI